MFKSIDCIWINSEIKSIVNNDCNSYKLFTDKGTIEYKFVKGVLILDINYTGDITFQLDMRDIYDFDDKCWLLQHSLKSRMNFYKKEGFI